MTLNITMLCHYAEYSYALLTIMPNGIMLCVILLNVFMLSVIMLNVVVLKPEISFNSKSKQGRYGTQHNDASHIALSITSLFVMLSIIDSKH